MRFDIEMPLATLFANYFIEQCAVQASGILDQSLCPIVTFFDPMSVDEEDRVVIFCPDAATDAPGGGHFEATINVYQKTQWAQVTLQENFTLHFGRVNEWRDKLFATNILTLLNSITPPGFTLDGINLQKNLTTKILGDRGGFIESEAFFVITGCFTPGT